MTDGGGSLALCRDRTRGGVTRLAMSIAAWHESWRGDAEHADQIARCRAALDALVARLQELAATLPLDETGFGACRRLDAYATMVERLLAYFRDRFAQRRDARLAPVLRAADALIISCVQQARALASPAGQPMPLAFIEPAFSASATPRTASNPTVGDKRLRAMLDELPIPLISLPVHVVDEPWWLALVAHEVGHHVQYDVDANAVAATGTALAAACGEEWVAWRYEVFADVFAVLALGPPAIAMIAELEWGTAAELAAKRALYPPVVVRLALLAEVARLRGFAQIAKAWGDVIERIVAELAGADRKRIAANLDQVGAAVAAVMNVPLGAGSLATLASCIAPDPVGAAGAAATATALARKLAGEDVVVPSSRTALRLAVGSAFDAFRALAAATDVDRPARQHALGARMLALVDSLRDTTTTMGGQRGSLPPFGGPPVPMGPQAAAKDRPIVMPENAPAWPVPPGQPFPGLPPGLQQPFAPPQPGGRHGPSAAEAELADRVFEALRGAEAEEAIAP